MLNAAIARAVNAEELMAKLRECKGGKLSFTETPNWLRTQAADRIEGLQKNVEYQKGLAGALLRKEDDTWDEALMKAAGLAMKGPEEGGLAKSMVFFAKEEDHWVYRQACLDYARAILELKRS